MKTVPLLAIPVMFAATNLMPEVALAKPKAGGRSSGSSSASSAPTNKNKAEEDSRKGGVSLNFTGKGSSGPNAATAAVAGGVAGSAAAAYAKPEADIPELSPQEEQKRREQQEAQEKAAADVRTKLEAARLEEEARRNQLLAEAEIEAQQRKRAEQLAANRQARRRAEEDRKRAWEERCQIKPVMSNAEIAICREVRAIPAR